MTFFFKEPFLTHSSFLPIILKAELKSCPPISTVKVFAVYIALHTLTSVIHTSSCLTAEVISFAAVFDYWIIWKTFSTLCFFLSKKKTLPFSSHSREAQIPLKKTYFGTYMNIWICLENSLLVKRDGCLYHEYFLSQPAKH